MAWRRKDGSITQVEHTEEFTDYVRNDIPSRENTDFTSTLLAYVDGQRSSVDLDYYIGSIGSNHWQRLVINGGSAFGLPNRAPELGKTNMFADIEHFTISGDRCMAFYDAVSGYDESNVFGALSYYGVIVSDARNPQKYGLNVEDLAGSDIIQAEMVGDDIDE